ncbi:cell wall anchor protein [Exiguobacterium sp. KKBO11]|uniref:SdrD B-like domain-containing protein n=1 Tax=Exiguobacterium sp. KKBO11 TaxID=1805000 RepID=UPI0007D858F9|nr:SdrD B-like domain-containing protein [Exiguobacterium sp. KKBO11]OAI88700.1 cell wall anchor protein [Exiguobacterium sp. KKBO11]
MKKLSLLLMALVVAFGLKLPVYAETVEWDVTGTGTGPYTLTFEGTGIVDITSETALVFEDGVTGEDVNIEETPVVTFTSETAPVVKVVSADGQRTILVEFGKVVTPEEPTTEEPTPETPVTEEPVKEDPATDEPVTEEPTPEEPVTEEPVKEEPTTDEPETGDDATPTPVEAPTTATIEGTIWFDENEDGIRQEKETRLDDVVVYLMDRNEDVIDEVYTKNGLYSFKDLKPGTYEVEVDGYDMGYYFYSEQNVGDDRTIDSDVDEDFGMKKVRLVAGQTEVIDAGIYGDEELDGMFEHWLAVVNFFDANGNQQPDFDEGTVPATYTVTDAITGKDVYQEKIAKDDLMMLQLDPGTYTIKTEVAAGYTVKAMHHLDMDDLMMDMDEEMYEDYESFAQQAKAMKLMASDEESISPEEQEMIDELLKYFERKSPEAGVTIEEGSLGTILLAEIAKAEPVAKPTPTPTSTETSVQTVESAEKQSKPTTTTATGTLPQAGEDKPFPYAATGAGLAIVGLWLLVRRGA